MHAHIFRRRLRIRHAADLLNLPIGLRLDLVQIANAIAADSGGLAITFRQKPFGDLPPLADHSIIDLGAHALIVVDPLEPDIEQFDAKHLTFSEAAAKISCSTSRRPFWIGTSAPKSLSASVSQSYRAKAHDFWWCE